MPELPEVQTIVDGLNKCILNQKIINIDVLEPKTLAPINKKILEGRCLKNISRLGKYIIFDLESLFLIVHLRMTGQFFYFKNRDYEKSSYDRVSFELEDGFLVFRDVRKFATMTVATSWKDVLGHIGPDALSKEFSQDVLFKICNSSTRCIKAVLLDQSKVAGIGNIYADEALYASHINPSSLASKIPKEAINQLYCAIIDVLIKGLESKGTSIGQGLGNYKHVNGRGENQDFLKVYGKKGHKCTGCGADFFKSTIASRGTTFCPICQKLYN